jgi:hypothetical protein
MGWNHSGASLRTAAGFAVKILISSHAAYFPRQGQYTAAPRPSGQLFLKLKYQSEAVVCFHFLLADFGQLPALL